MSCITRKLHVCIYAHLTSCLLQLKEHKMYPGSIFTLSSTDDCRNRHFFEFRLTPRRLPVETRFHSVLYISNTIIYSVLFSPRWNGLKCFSKVPQFGWTALPFMLFFYFKLSLGDKERKCLSPEQCQVCAGRVGLFSGFHCQMWKLKLSCREEKLQYSVL